MYKILEKPKHKLRQHKIAVRTQKGLNVIDIENITYLEGSGRYTNIYFKYGKSITVAKLLKLFENCLPQNFFRIHKSYLVNINSISEFKTNHKLKILLENGVELEIAKRRKAELFRKLSKWMV
jgi:two-component system, LytTR family, response regulator